MRARGPVWPTHRRRRAERARRGRKYPETVGQRQMNPQEMARDLVERELASPMILGQRKPPRKPRNGDMGGTP